MPGFDDLMAKYGVVDCVVWLGERGWHRYREYYDGGWLEGYRSEPVEYWGA